MKKLYFSFMYCFKLKMKQKTGSLLSFGVFLVIMLGNILQVSSQTNTWTGAGGTDWNTASSWDLGHVPLSAEDVVVPEGYSVIVSSTGMCNSLTVNTGATVTNNATLIINASLSGSGELINGASADLYIYGNALISTLTAIAEENDVIYHGFGAQTVKGTIYENLSFAGRGTKTLDGNTDVGGILTVRAFNELALGTNSLGSTTAPWRIILECGAWSGSVISGTGNLYVDYFDQNNQVIVNNAGTGIGGAIISCPLLLHPGVSSKFIGFDISDDGYVTTDLTVSGAISVGGSVNKYGAGTLMLSGLNTHTGQTNILEGILKLGASGNGIYSPLGTSSEPTNVSSGAVFDLNGITLSTTEKLYVFGTGILNGGALVNSSPVSANYSGFVYICTNSVINTIGDIVKTTNALQKLPTNVMLTKIGAGKLIMKTGFALFNGMNITEGTIELGSGDLITNTEPVFLNGGIFSTGESTGFSDIVGNLTLTNNSCIHLGTGIHTLKFAASNVIGWTEGKILTITGWTGTPGSSGTGGKIFFGTAATGLTTAQLSQIRFDGFPGFPTLLSTGELVPQNVPDLAITGTTDHGFVCIGGSADPVTYTITNTGTVAAEGITVNSDNSGFTVSGLSSTTIASGGGTATFQVTFNPSAAGIRNAIITVSSTTSGAISPKTSVTGTAIEAVTTANAGTDQSTCYLSAVSLAANTPEYGTGSWSVVSGPDTSTDQFSSLADPSATFTPSVSGEYSLRWTISNTSCTSSTDDVTITVTDCFCFGAALSVYQTLDPDNNMTPENAVSFPDVNWASIGQNEYIALDLTGGSRILGDKVTVTWSKWEGQAGGAPDAYVWESQDGINYTYITHELIYNTTSTFKQSEIPVKKGTRYLKIVNSTQYWLFVKSITFNYYCTGCSNGILELKTENDVQSVCMFASMNDIVYAVGGGATGAVVSGLPFGISGSNSNGNFIISGVPLQVGTFTYTVSTTGTTSPCTKATINGTITVIPPPTVTAGTYGPTCSTGSDILLDQATPTGGIWKGSGLIQKGSDTYFSPSAGTQTLTYTYTNENSCSASESTTITVYDPPEAGSISGISEICAGSTTQLSVSSGATQGGTWTSNAPTVASVNTSSGLVAGESAGVATIKYTVSGQGGCANDFAEYQVSVTTAPVAGVITASRSSILVSDTVWLKATGGDPSGTWATTNASIATVNTEGMVTGVALGKVTISYTVTGTGGCSDSKAEYLITVTLPPDSCSGYAIIANTISGPITNPENATGAPDGKIADMESNSYLLLDLTGGGIPLEGEFTITWYCSSNYQPAWVDIAESPDGNTWKSIDVKTLYYTVGNTSPETRTFKVSRGTRYIRIWNQIWVHLYIDAVVYPCPPPCDNATLELTSGSDSQTVNQHSAIDDIVYAVGGSATGAEVTGLPTGITGYFSGGVLTISGSPTGLGTYPYTVKTTGITYPCTETSVNGSISVKPLPANCYGYAVDAWTGSGYVVNAALINGNPDGLVASLGTDTKINVDLTGVGTTPENATISWYKDDLYINPMVYFMESADGINWKWIYLGQQLLRADVYNTSPGTYTIPVSDGTRYLQIWNNSHVWLHIDAVTYSCPVLCANGLLELNSGDTVQSVCLGNKLTDIVYTVGGDATGAEVAGLPEGVDGNYSNGTFTISGTPTKTGVSKYTLITTGVESPCTNDTTTGSLTTYELPVVTTGTYGPLCNTSTGIPLNQGSPSGGVWTGTGVSGNQTDGYLFNPAGIEGDFLITYTFTNDNSCTNSANTTITVYDPPEAGSISGMSEICTGDGTQLGLSGDADKDGTWTSTDPGVATVDPSGKVTGVSMGTSTITYKVAGQGGCEDDKAEFLITVGVCNSTTYNTSGDYYFVVPSEVTRIDVKAWGGGGGGSYKLLKDNSDLNNPVYEPGAGGGGGGFSGGTIPVTPGETIHVVVGMGGPCGGEGYSDGDNGWFSSVENDNEIFITAYGGKGAVWEGELCIPGEGNDGHFSNSVINPVVNFGGNGACGIFPEEMGYGGGGGGGAGVSENGSDGVDDVGGAGGNNGGGRGGDSDNPGSPYGGGGGGVTTNQVSSSGDGANGAVILSWVITSCSDATLDLTSETGTDAQTVCENSPIVNITYAVGVATGTEVTGLPTGVSGNYSNGTLTISGTPGTAGFYEYTVNTTGISFPCKNAGATGTITVNALPDATFAKIASNTPVCSGENAEFHLTGTPGATVTYRIDEETTTSTATLDATTGLVTISLGTVTANHKMTLVSVTDGTCTKTLSSDATVVVNPLPDASFAAIASNTPVCSGENAEFHLSGTPGATVNYLIDEETTTSAAILDTKTGLATVTLSGVTADCKITLVSVSDGSCKRNLDEAAVVIVNPLPEATFAKIPSNTPICEGGDAEYYLRGTPGASVTYRIDNEITTAKITLDVTTGIATVRFNGVATDRKLTLISVTDGTCTISLNENVTVTVDALPDATFAETASNTTVCPNSNAEFYLKGTANATVTYSLDDGLTKFTKDLDNLGEATVTVTGALSSQTLTLYEVYQASTECGKPLSESTTVVVEDLVPPAFTRPKDTTIYRNTSCIYDARVEVTGDVDDESDNCDVGEATWSDYIEMNDLCDMIIERTWSLMDNAGNKADDQIQFITIKDTVRPVIQQAPGSLDVTVNCNDARSLDNALELLPAALDNCTRKEEISRILVSDITLPDGTCPNASKRTRTWYFTDDCGNKSQNFIQTINIVDNQAPVLKISTETSASLNQFGLPRSLTEARNFDAKTLEDDVAFLYTDCGAVTALLDETKTEYSGTDCGWTAVYTFVVSDGCSNQTSCQVTYGGSDEVSPEWAMTMPGDITVECDEIPGRPLIKATDNSGEAVSIQLREREIPGSCPNKYTLIRQWIAEDACENTNEYEQTITVVDSKPPVLIDADKDCATLNSSDNNWCLSVANDFDATTLEDDVAALYKDNCGTVKATYAGKTPDEDNSSCFWSITYHFTVDDGCSNSITCDVVYSGGDNEAPQLMMLQSVSPGLNSTDNNWCLAKADAFDAKTLESAVAAVYQDNCSAVKATYTGKTAGENNSDCAWLFTYHFLVEDECGESTAFNVVYSGGDLEDPVAICTDINIQLDEYGKATIEEDAVDNGSTDNCASMLSFNTDVTSFDCSNFGANTVVLTVTDGCDRISTCQATVTVEDKVAPVLTCGAGSPFTRKADLNCTWYTVDGSEFDAKAEDACGISSLTWNCPTASATIMTTTTTLEGVQLAFGTHLITWTATDVNGNKSVSQFMVTVEKRSVVLTYTGEVKRQYSDETNLSAKLVDLTGTPLSGKTIRFTVGSQSVTDDTDANGVATATLILDQSPIPAYVVKTEFDGDEYCLPASDEDPFDITQENALIAYSGQEFVGEQNPDVTSTPLVLSATVTDVDDSFRGNITNARVQFYDVNTLKPLSEWLTPGLIIPGDTTLGWVTQIWNAPVPVSGYNTFTIGVMVGTQDPEDHGYYAGSDKTVVNVYRTDLYEFISGGGHIIPIDSRGEYASDPGRKVNFGFNVKWNKSMRRLQGNLNLIFRVGEKVYQIKTNALNSLSINSVNPCSQTAVFTSKANLTDVTQPDLPGEIKGNLDLQVTMTSNTSPGSVSTIGFTLFDGNTLWYSSSWPVNQTEEMELSAGNLIVHNGIECVENNEVDVMLYSSRNPSFVGEEVIFEAVVTPKGSALVPEGEVVFRNGTEWMESVVMSSGKASLSVNDFKEGIYPITAEYVPMDYFAGAVSNVVEQEVFGAILSVESDINPSSDGETVTFTATVTGPSGGIVPTGTITFSDGENPLGTADLTGGSASLQVSSLTPGDHIIHAVYSGDANYDPLSASLNQTVKSNVSVTLGSSKNPEQVNKPVTFTASVTVNGSPVSGIEVSFYINGTLLPETKTTNSSGMAVAEYSFATTGTYLVEARYAGQSASLSQVIKNKVKSGEIDANDDFVLEMVNLKVYPNPFDDRLRFEFSSPEPVYARIDIYDITGRLIETIFEQQVEEKITYQANFKPLNVVSAMYLYRVKLGDSTFVDKALYNNRK